jgi:hypothetical protein
MLTHGRRTIQESMAAFRETIANQSGDVTKIQDGGHTCCVF